jgi:hypothetical protein
VHANIDATIASIDGEPVRHVDSDDALCGGTGVNTPECTILDECSHIPVTEWRAHHVSAWLTYELGVENERQRRAIHENIKSGKVLLALTDSDLQTIIGIGHPLMVRKVRAGIDELRADKVCVTGCTHRLYLRFYAVNIRICASSPSTMLLINSWLIVVCAVCTPPRSGGCK